MKLSVLVVAASVILITVPAYAGDEVTITTGSYDQKNLAIYDVTIVWADNRNGNWDICGYNLSTKEKFQVTSDPTDQQQPSIYGDFVVWTDNRNGNEDIYGYNIQTHKEVQITTDPHDQRAPALNQNVVVWEDNRNGNWDIFAYDLSTGEEMVITAEPHDQDNPAIFNTHIVWCDWRNDHKGMYGYNLVTNEEFCIIKESKIIVCPVLYGDDVFWIDSSSLYSYNFTTKKKSEIPSFLSLKQDLSVCGDVLVWAELRNVGGRTDICGCNLKTGAELSIATGPEWQLGPAVYGDFVVWVERKEDWTGSRICGRSISTVTATPLPLIMRMPFGFNCLYGGLFITALIGSSFMMRKWSLRDSFFPGKGRELRRGPYYSVGFLISATIFAFWGFRLLSNFRDESGLMLLLPCTLSLLGFFWYRENPYVRITEERIILFDALFYPQIIARDEIRDIKFQPWKARIELVLDGRTIRVDLSAVKPEQKRDLITLLHVRTQDPTREENSE
jgi:TolB protein